MSFTQVPDITALLAAIDAGAYKTPSARLTAIEQAGGPEFVQLQLIRQWLASAGGTAAWGAITGTITDQTDLVNYVSGLVAGLLDFKGSTNCSTNPNYPAALKGDAYVVSVAGKIGGASGKVVEVGDMYVASADNAGGAEGSVGTSWFVLQANITGITAAGLTLMRGSLSQGADGGSNVTLTDAAAAAAILSFWPGGLLAGRKDGPTGVVFLGQFGGTNGLCVGADGTIGFSATVVGAGDIRSADTNFTRFKAGVFGTPGLAPSIRIVTGTDTVDSTPGDHTIVGNHATVAFSITLLAAAANTGRHLVIKNKGAAAVTVDATGLGQIFTTALVNTMVLSTGDSITLQSDGATWLVL